MDPPMRPSFNPGWPVCAAFMLCAATDPPQPSAPPEGPEIVVVAPADHTCRVMLADRSLSTRELRENARQWAAEGVPVRVVRPAGADYHCMVQIAFKLGDYGVRLIQFIERHEGEGSGSQPTSDCLLR